ncbi:hypothetical protein [Nostoc sp. FACHB-888]|nr:hypothetical protein [Nostoc sp. FACHB-888]
MTNVADAVTSSTLSEIAEAVICIDTCNVSSVTYERFVLWQQPQ